MIEADLLVEFISGDLQPTEDVKREIERIIETNNTFYSDLLYTLTHERFPESTAHSIFQEILKHKYEVSQILGRNIGIRVATLDYLENIKGILKSPKIIESDEFSKIFKYASTDPLTGLNNRLSFFTKLKEEIEKNGFFTIAMFDLDNFKSYNDEKGHQAGDILLQEFSNLLREILKGIMTARYGGDEFMAIFPDSKIQEIKDRIIQLQKDVETMFKQFNITLSSGLAEFPEDGKTASELVSSVDEALYRAKEFGGNKIIHFKTIVLTYQPTDEIVNEVSCVGDFNKWNKNINKMIYDESEKCWSCKIRLKPGRYRYKFLINNIKWIPDIKASEFVDDGFGGSCSVLKVE